MSIPQNITDGFRTFVRLIPLTQNPIERKYIQSEFDLVEVLHTIRDKFADTNRMLGKQKYRNTDFDFIDDVKEEMQECLLGGKTSKDIAVQRKKYLVTYHLVVEPIIEIFSQYDHYTALQHVDAVLDEIEQMFLSHEISGNYDDSIVAKAQVSKMIEHREAARLLQKKKRKRSNRKEKVVEDELHDVVDIINS